MLQIITDSSAEFTEEEAEVLGIRVVPLTVVFGQEAYLEGVELSKKEFYRRLLAGESPHTSQPSVEQFSRVFAATEGEETLVLVISSVLSGTINAARLAKEEGGFTQVHIFDTLCTTAMLRILVETAVMNREKSAEEVMEILKELRPRLRLHACLDTLEYLRRGGRIKRSAAIVGELLGIKPLIEVTKEGTVRMTGKVRGQKKALAEVKLLAQAGVPDEAYPIYYLQTEPDAPARALREALDKEGRILRICCAVGTHIGPNAAGVVYVASTH